MSSFNGFIASRYENASAEITLNTACTDWTEFFQYPIIVTVILDRLLHHSVMVNNHGHSFRLKGKLPVEALEP